MDYLSHFRREVRAFEAAARRAVDVRPAPLVPSCPGWSVSDLVQHLGGVHRFVARVVEDRLSEPPDVSDPALFGLPEVRDGWPDFEAAPNRGAMPKTLLDWFAEGAAALEALFVSRDPGEGVWTWSQDRTTGFWLRMQSIEAAVHRWDAEGALGTPHAVDAALASDAIKQNFEVMAPARRAAKGAPPGSGERFRLRRTDGPDSWTAAFDGDEVRLTTGDDAPCDVELAGPASDLTLFLWQRIPADRLETSGDRKMLDRYFTLVPPM